MLTHVMGCLALMGSLSGCAILEPEIEADIVNETGTIEVIGPNGGVLLAADHAPPPVTSGKTPFYLYPHSLPDRYRRDGLRVLFSANLEPCDDMGQCGALPVRIVTIRPLQ